MPPHSAVENTVWCVRSSHRISAYSQACSNPHGSWPQLLGHLAPHRGRHHRLRRWHHQLAFPPHYRLSLPLPRYKIGPKVQIQELILGRTSPRYGDSEGIPRGNLGGGRLAVYKKETSVNLHHPPGRHFLDLELRHWRISWVGFAKSPHWRNKRRIY